MKGEDKEGESGSLLWTWVKLLSVSNSASVFIGWDVWLNRYGGLFGADQTNMTNQPPAWLWLYLDGAGFLVWSPRCSEVCLWGGLCSFQMAGIVGSIWGNGFKAMMWGWVRWAAIWKSKGHCSLVLYLSLGKCIKGKSPYSSNELTGKRHHN